MCILARTHDNMASTCCINVHPIALQKFLELKKLPTPPCKNKVAKTKKLIFRVQEFCSSDTDAAAGAAAGAAATAAACAAAFVFTTAFTVVVTMAAAEQKQ